jgi:phosphatidylinositol alpha-1,6-mannosyltransferase
MTVDAPSIPNGQYAPRLLLLSTEFPPGPGGIGTHAYQVARHLHGLGWAVEVVSPQPYVPAAQRDAFNAAQPFGVTTLDDRQGGRLWPARRLSAIAAAVRAHRPDVVVATGSRALWAAAVVAPPFRLPWVAIAHGSEFAARSSTERRLTALAASRATAVVAVSRYTAGLVERVCRPRSLHVILNAADGEQFRPGLETGGLKREWGLNGGPVLLTVGNVTERKAQDVVIRALPDVLARHPHATYLIAGLPTRRAEFEEVARAVGVAERVRFTGIVPAEQLPAVYNLCDLFVLVSRTASDGDTEGYGIVVQEAALCGKPAVVSQGCGLTEAIHEGVTGLSVPPESPEETAAAILALLDDDAVRGAMGEAARRAAAGTTWAQRAGEYDALLGSLVGKRKVSKA